VNAGELSPWRPARNAPDLESQRLIGSYPGEAHLLNTFVEDQPNCINIFDGELNNTKIDIDIIEDPCYTPSNPFTSENRQWKTH
jgi:hypothetical protein